MISKRLNRPFLNCVIFILLYRKGCLGRPVHLKIDLVSSVLFLTFGWYISKVLFKYVIRDHSFSTYVKFFEKLTFCTPLIRACSCNDSFVFLNPRNDDPMKHPLYLCPFITMSGVFLQKYLKGFSEFLLKVRVSFNLKCDRA